MKLSIQLKCQFKFWQERSKAHKHLATLDEVWHLPRGNEHDTVPGIAYKSMQMMRVEFSINLKLFIVIIHTWILSAVSSVASFLEF